MVCVVCGEKYIKGESGKTICPSCSISEATLTLWQESLSPEGSAEDSIRISHDPDALSEIEDSLPKLSRPEHNSETAPDFDIGEKLGSGGMGIVYSANQTALNRSVAIKMIKPGNTGLNKTTSLITEAVVTGQLEHPNVVPIYDLGVDAEGNTFYAMKQIKGLLWSKLMPEKSLDENLDILLRVADTISFAHSRGILHRDIKPQNIMLGEFGETTVMDWGASCSLKKSKAIGVMHAESSFCGTPAYMPPEMARGDANRYCEASDVYQLGAVLYQIMTGHPPRTEKDTILCLSQAAENHIEPVTDESELIRIAFKAMSTAPVDRFITVRDFQDNVRDYRTHSESLMVLENSKVHLQQAKVKQDYELFNRAIYGFREAIQLWQETPDAERLCNEANLFYAQCAFEKNDLELAQSLLNPSESSHKPLLDSIIQTIRERDAHIKRNKQLRIVSLGLGVIMLIVLACAFFIVRSAQQETIRQHKQGLSNLISAHYGEQNYEATVATFWELHHQYGMDILDEEALLSVRVAAAMNPWRGSINTGIKDPQKIMPAVEDDYLWVVGKRELVKVRLDLEIGYDPSSMVSIHDYTFGKHLPPGSVTKRIELPFELSSGEAVHESNDGTLWAGSGKEIYRKNGTNWNTVIDITQLEFPPLPVEFGFNEEKREDFHQWMEREARNLSITGVLLNRMQDRAVVTLGGGVVCWIDLPEQKCLGWYFIDMDSYLKTLKFAKRSARSRASDAGSLYPEPNGPQLLFSPDEQWLLYREGCRGTFAFAFEMPLFIRKNYFYSQDYLFGDFVFLENNRLWGLLDFQSRVFSATTATLSRYWGTLSQANGRGWDTIEYEMRRVPEEDWRLATLSPTGMECFLITKNNSFFAGSTVAERGFDLHRKVVGRDWVDCLLLENGTAFVLTNDGAIHAYDAHQHAIQELQLNAKVVDVCKGHHPNHLFAILKKQNGKTDVIEISEIKSAKPYCRVLVKDTDAARICCDPKGRWLVALSHHEGKVIDLSSNKIIATIPAEGGSLGPIKFDKTGEYLLYGGNWQYSVKIHRSSDWKKICDFSSKRPPIVGLTMYHEGEDAFILTTSGKMVKSMKLVQDMDTSSSLVWSLKTEHGNQSVIPVPKTRAGENLYWCRTLFDRFQMFDASTGEFVSDHFNYWQKKELKTPVYIENGNRILFLTEGRRLEMALRSDLYPLFDSRSIEQKIDKVIVNSDESMVGIICGDKLSFMNLSGLLLNKKPARTPTHYVSNSGLNVWPYDSWITAANDVQNAIKATDTGDEIILDDGTFHSKETIIIQDPITIRSRNGPKLTIIDADGNGSVFNMRSKIEGLSRIEGLTITGGNGQIGGGFNILNTDNILITNCIIKGNTAYNGGGIGIQYWNPSTAGSIEDFEPGFIEISNCVLTDNIATRNGGALKVHIPEEAILRLNINHCEIVENSAGNSGGGLCLNNQNSRSCMNISDCQIIGNQTGDTGQDVFAGKYSLNCVISNSVLSLCSTNSGVEGCVFKDCTFIPD